MEIYERLIIFECALNVLLKGASLGELIKRVATLRLGSETYKRFNMFLNERLVGVVVPGAENDQGVGNVRSLRNISQIFRRSDVIICAFCFSNDVAGEEKQIKANPVFPVSTYGPHLRL